MKELVIKKLDDVCELITCGVAAKPKYVDNGIPFLSAKNVKDGQVIWSGYNCISEETHRELTKNNKPIIGDILYTRVGSYGEAAVVEDDKKFSVFVSLTLIKIDKSILNNYYLKYYLNSDAVKRLAKKSISSSGVGNLNVGTVRKFPIPVPPLPEQQRIVSILDEAFVAIAKAKANAEQNLRNAKELFDCVLNSILYDEKWEVKELGQACTKVEYGSSTKSTTEGKIAVLRMGNIQNGHFVWDSLVYSNNEDDNKQYILKYNDVLFNRTNSPELVGKTAIYKSEMPAIFAGYLIRIHRKEDLLDADYLNYYLNSKMANDYGKTVVISSVNQANINGSKLKTYPIPLPSLKEQQIIVRQLDALNLETKKLEAIYQQKIKNLEELKKSILQKAFSGELKTEKALAI